MKREMPKLPNIDAAVVADAKLVRYLLDTTHPRGGAKARFLRRFGFSASRPDEARQALIEHARTNDVRASYSNPFGIIFEIDGPLSSPDGRDPVVRTVWTLDKGETAPRLITIIPRDMRGREV